jgi:hypothetical protein
MRKKALSSSNGRFRFQAENYENRLAERGVKVEDSDETQKIWESYYAIATAVRQNEQESGWEENNLEHDLRSTDWILERVRNSEVYAQNLYAALCNNSFQKLDAWQILNDKTWQCSWRYAGGIVADMKGSGDYIDYYCSGIGSYMNEDEVSTLEAKEKERYDSITSKFVSESVVTEEIKSDLKRLGWIVIPEDQNS